MHQIAFYKMMAFFRKRNGNIPKELDEDYDAIIDNDLEKETTRQAIFDKTFPHLDKDCQQIITLVAEKKTDQEIADDVSNFKNKPERRYPKIRINSD